MAKKKAAYFEEMKALLRQGDGEGALRLMDKAMDEYPNDPFVMSYYGCLLALAGNQAQKGIRICKDAIKRLKESVPVGSEFFHPMFYLNLGRAQLAIGEKNDAVKAFKLGLKMDPDNKDILGEMKKLGVRKPPLVPFLKRSNPLNKYIGLLLRRITKAIV